MSKRRAAPQKEWGNSFCNHPAPRRSGRTGYHHSNPVEALPKLEDELGHTGSFSCASAGNGVRNGPVGCVRPRRCQAVFNLDVL
jgi:hypothetical protein